MPILVVIFRSWLNRMKHLRSATLLLFMAFCAMNGFGQAAQASFVTGSGANAKTTYVPGAGFNRLLVVTVSREQGTPGTVSTLTYGVQAMTFVRGHTQGNVRTEVWYLNEAGIRAGGYCGAAFTVTWSSALTGPETFGVITLKDTDQTTPVAGAAGVGFNSGNTASGTTVGTGNMTGPGIGDIVVYGSTSDNNRVHTAAAGYTQRTYVVSAGTVISQAMASKEITVAATENPLAAWAAAGTGLINVGVVFNGVVPVSTATTYTFYSFATGAWDANTTWSFSESGGAAVQSGVWPRRTDNVVIKSGHTVTIDNITDNKSCGITANSLAIANVGAGGGGASYANSATAVFYHSGIITVRGTLQETGGSNDFLTSGTMTVVTGGAFSTNSTFANIGYLEVQSSATFSAGNDFIISGTSTSLVNSSITITNDFGIDWTSATICGSGVASLSLGPSSAIVLTNGATLAQMCSTFTVACPGGGCTGATFPAAGSTVMVTGNTGPAGVGNATQNVLWLRSSDISQANNTALASWTDASGNGNNASQATAGLRPNFFTNVVNTSIPAVRFVGSGTDYMTLGQPANLNFIPRTSEHIYFAAVNVATGAFGTIISRALSASRQWQYTVDQTTPNVFGYFRGGDFNAGSQVATGGWKISAAIVGTNITTGFSGSANGVADAGPSTVGTATAASTDVLVGARRDLSNTDANFYLTGDIGEIILYNLALSPVHRILIENYLAAKFNITGLGTEVYTGDAAGYDYDVAGIGMTGGVAYRDAKGPGVVRMWNPSALVNGDFLMWGHNGTTYNQSVTGASNVDNIVIKERLIRIWRLTETGDVGTINISFDIAALGGTVVGSNLRLLIDRDGNWTTNDVTPIAGAYAGNVVTFYGVDFQANDLFTLGNTDATTALPIELVSFNAVPHRDAVRLEWETLSERNNDFFTVERSLDGESWSEVAFVKGAGSSSSKQKYSAYDEAPVNGFSYYRLRQTDFDGAFKYSAVQRVELQGIVNLNVSPNPSGGAYTISVSEDISSAQVRVLDVLGRPVPFTMTRQINSMSVEPHGVAAGIYFIHIAAPSWTRTVRVVRE
jgi:hypothetical protein